MLRGLSTNLLKKPVQDLDILILEFLYGSEMMESTLSLSEIP